VFRKEIFEYLYEGEELVIEPFQRLIAKKLLSTHPYAGFWRSMDTFKDKQQLDELVSQGVAPWELWKQPHENA
jgi:glucose-1-phosphate cytidylyltransferase